MSSSCGRPSCPWREAAPKRPADPWGWGFEQRQQRKPKSLFDLLFKF